LLKHALRRSTGALIAGTMAVSGLAVFAAPAEAAVTANTLSFTRFNSANTADAYLVDADGTNMSRVFDLPGDDGLLNWSPDRSKVLFTAKINSTYDLFFANGDFSNITPVPGASSDSLDEIYGKFSPDGSKIAYGTQDSTGSYTLHVMNSDGTNNRTLAGSADSSFMPNAWSTDGSSIITTRQYNTSPYGNTITLVRVSDGTTTDITPRLAANGTSNYAFGGSMTPDGKQIVFGGGISGTYSLFSVNVDGTNLVDLGKGATPNAWFPAVSPDGKKIAYSSLNSSDYSFDLYVLDVATGSTTQVTSGPDSDVYPAWAPADATQTAQPADLSVSMTASATNLSIGDTATLTINGRNNGPGAATDAALTLTLDDGLAFAGAAPSGCTYSGQTMRCTYASAPSGANGTYQPQVTQTASGIHNASVTVSANTPDPNPSNNSASVALGFAVPGGVTNASNTPAGANAENSQNGLSKRAANQPPSKK
jgi:TolB protein